MSEIKALTSLRGIFALWVLAYHLYVTAPSAIADPTRLMQKGYLGVDFFFLLSGFILAAVYGPRFLGTRSRGTWRRFLVVRAGRMFPLHVAVTVICVAAGYWVGHGFSLIQVVEEATLVQRWPFVHAIFRSINGPSWSISTEWLANILFPFFVLMTLRSAWQSALIVGVAAACVLGVLGWNNGGSLDLSPVNTLSPLGRCFTEFALGMLLYRWNRIAPSSGIVVVALFAIGGIAIYARMPDVLVVGLMIPLIPAVANNRGNVGTMLSAPILHWLGEVSFSIYLVHLPIMLALKWLLDRAEIGGLLGDAVLAISTIAVTLTVSTATYYSIEVWGRDRSREFAVDIFRDRAAA